MAFSPLVLALRVCGWAYFACLLTGGALAGTFPSLDSTPKTVNSFQDALTTTFSERTALLLANSTGVVGGTGSTNSRLVFIKCLTPADECQLTNFPDSSAGEYVGVLYELGVLPRVLKLFAEGADGDEVPSIPSAIIALPASENVTFSPASTNPLIEFRPAAGPESDHQWNLGGADLLDVAVPFGVFLAPAEEATVIEQHTESNGNGVRGTNVAEYGSSVKLETQINLESNSTACVPAGTCAPMGGYSVWASMPPQTNSTGAARRQLLVLSHWDSQGLFRSIISGTHSAQSGLVTMLLAADILSQNGRGEGYELDILFTSLSGDAFDLMASRKLLYDLQHKEQDVRAAASLDGFDADRLDAIVEVGMLGFDAGAFNGTGGSGGGLFVHTVNGTTQSTAASAIIAGADTTASSLTVSAASQTYLPPSSLLLWQKGLPEVDSVYLGDFDTKFSNKRFWGRNDDGVHDWSASQVALSAAILARALHSIASGSATPSALVIDQEAVEAHAEELFGCLSKPNGLECDLVQSMTSPFKDSSHAAEQFVSVISWKPDDEQDNGRPKKNIELFVWEYLANRTFTGEAEQVDCRHTKRPCNDGKVCLHEYGGGDPGGKCVTATIKYTASHSTLFDYTSCEESEERSCEAGWDVVGSEPTQWASGLGLPPDKGWAETYNEEITVDVNLRESSNRDVAILLGGIFCTAVALAAVLAGQALHGRFKID